MCVNCDWLQWSVRLNEPTPELQCPQGYRLELLQGNNIYQYRAILYDGQGRKWLTMLWKPYSSVLDDKIMIVQASNWLLYCDAGYNITELLLQVVDCEFNSMGRVDICVDFVMCPRIMDILKHLNSGHYYVQGKKAGSSWWHERNLMNDNFFHKELHCQTWGSATSDIKWKIYYKSLEINAIEGMISKCDKPWIFTEWDAAGMDVKNVWRIEVSLCGACCLRFDEKKITLENALSGEWLSNVFGDMLERRFIIRVNQGRRTDKHNKDTRVPLFSFPWMSVRLRWTRPRDTPAPSAAIVSVRRLMRCLDDSSTMANPIVFNSIANSVIDIVESERLDVYFKDRFGTDPITYFTELSGSIGVGTHNAIATPSMMFD